MAAYLVPLDAAGCVIPLEKAILLVGRQADCDISITTSRKISRRHCAVAVVNNTVIIRDLGSTNGVTINGTRVEKEAQLSWGDEVVIGDVRFRFQKELTPVITNPNRASTRPTGVPTLDVDGEFEPVALTDDSRGPVAEPAPRSRPKSKAAPDMVDSGPLVPFQSPAENFIPLASDSA